MRSIVTGGFGFIGSHLTERLLAEGHEVVVIDNLATGRRENLDAVCGHPRLQAVFGNLSQPEEYAGAFRGADWVFHLAGLAGLAASLEWPWTYFQANVAGTLAALEAARGAGVTRFIYAASASCYGEPERTPTPEEAPIRPQVPCALAKHLAETCAFHWSAVYGLAAVSLRLFNVYGPPKRMNAAYGSVLGVFLAQKRQGKPLTVMGDGRQTRDFVHVSDVVEAFLRAAGAGRAGTAYNVGSGVEHSVLELADLLGGPVIHLPARTGEVSRGCADIRRIRRELGWSPQVEFEDGVRALHDSIEDWRSAPVWTASLLTESARAASRTQAGAVLA